MIHHHDHHNCSHDHNFLLFFHRYQLTLIFNMIMIIDHHYHHDHHDHRAHHDHECDHHNFHRDLLTLVFIAVLISMMIVSIWRLWWFLWLWVFDDCEYLMTVMIFYDSLLVFLLINCVISCWYTTVLGHWSQSQSSEIQISKDGQTENYISPVK